MKHLNAVIFFDLDNTLIEIRNSHRFFDSIIVDVFNDKCIDPPIQEERNKLWRDANFKELLVSWNYPDPTEFWKKFDEIDLRKRKELHSQGQLVLFEDVIPVLKRLADSEHIRNILITNASKEIADFELEKFNLVQYFDEILALGDIQEDCKPNPKRIVQTLASLSKQYSFSKDQVYIVGDSPFDVSAGKNADIISILLRRDDGAKKKWIDKPKFHIQAMDQIFSILKI